MRAYVTADSDGIVRLHYGATGAIMAPCRVCESKMFLTTPTECSRERAARARLFLQEYLRSRLIADASQPTVEEVLERAGTREGGKVAFSSAVSHIRAERDHR